MEFGQINKKRGRRTMLAAVAATMVALAVPAGAQATTKIGECQVTTTIFGGACSIPESAAFGHDEEINGVAEVRGVAAGLVSGRVEVNGCLSTGSGCAFPSSYGAKSATCGPALNRCTANTSGVEPEVHAAGGSITCRSDGSIGVISVVLKCTAFQSPSPFSF